MSEKRFSYLTGAMGVLFYDGDEMIPYPKVCEILNKVDEQQATIQQLKAKLKEKEEDERLYANEILELREANKEFIQFKELGGDY